MTPVLETWTCPVHGIIVRNIVKNARPKSMNEVIAYHRIHDHCFAFLSIHSEDVEDTDTLNKENDHRQSEETKDEI